MPKSKKRVKGVKAWAHLDPDNTIPETSCAYNHWNGNTALAIFKTRKEAKEWAGPFPVIPVLITPIINRKKR